MSKLVAGQYIFQLTVTDNSGATATAQVKITVSPAANQMPTANAGSNQTITLPINTVTLDGSNSADPDGTIASYAWTKISGPSSGTIASAGSSTTDINNLVQGTYLYKLTVTDNSGATDADSVTITVNAAPNKAPTANAGTAKNIMLPATSLALDGSKSSDPDGTISGYAWSQVSGPSTATFSSKTSATPTVSKLVAGQYIFQLTVTDNSGATATAQVKITVSPAANQPPSANAGSNQTITLPNNTVTLDGSNSGDPDGTIASYSWTKISGPSSGTIASAGSSSTAINNLVQGTYLYKLTVTDNSGATDADSVTITVNAAPNQSPTANAGTAKNITLPASSIALDGSKSSDPDGTISGYAWSQVSGPSTATFSSKTNVAPKVSKLVAGQYIFQLAVTDNSGATTTAQVKITVTPAANQAPSANAGSNQTITLPTNTVTLDGSNSADPDGTISTYAWTKISGPASGTIASAGSSTTAINNLVQGTYLYKLTVTDNSGATDADSVTITVKAAPNQLPVANAGTSKSSKLPTISKSLDGSGSTDPDGTISGYAWSQVSGPSTATFSSKTSATPTVSKLVAGQYIFQLTVTDNSGATATAQVKITVSPAANVSPSANAGSNQTITLPTNSVTLDGSGSQKGTGTITGYAWSRISGPSGSSFVNGAGVSTVVNNLAQGTYVFKLIVTDNNGMSDADSVTITVNAAPNQAPTANAGTTKRITLPVNSVSLDGTKSSDPDGTIAGYAWTQVSGPSTATISGGGSASPTVSNLVAGQYIFQLTVTDNNGATDNAQVKITVSPAANQAPTANAGSSQAITLPTSTVTLDGSASDDVDGTIAAYAWSQVSGPATASIVNKTSATTDVNSLAQGTYVFQLTVTDNSGATSTDQVTVTVNAAVNIVPVANAGSGKTITLPVNSVNLDGSKSSDADGTIASYAWTQVSGPSAATLANANTVAPVASNLKSGQYVFQLVVTDNDGATDNAQVKITVVAAANQPPSASAGSNIIITAPVSTITLDGSASSDPDGSITTYAWSQLSGPSTAIIVSSGSATTSVTGLEVGTYTFQLGVTDNSGATSTDPITVIVMPAPNQAPNANAGNNRSITLPVNSVNLSGSRSNDPDGSIAGYAWIQVSGPSTATLTNDNTVAPTASGLIAGQYIFQLTVTDNVGATDFAQVKVTVIAAANQAPTANAGSSVAITAPASTVTLDGSASSDPDGTIASYSWSQSSGPSTATITSGGTATTTVNSLAVGTYVFELTVTDNNGATAGRPGNGNRYVGS